MTWSRWLLVAVALFIAFAAAIRVSSQRERMRPHGGTTASGGTREGLPGGSGSTAGGPQGGATGELQIQNPTSQRNPTSQHQTDEQPREPAEGSADHPELAGSDGSPADSTYYPGGEGSFLDPESRATAETRIPAHGTGRIFGTVLGKDGLPVQLVLVTVRREEDGGTLDLKPDPRGQYEAVNLAGGTYVVVCAVRGEGVLSRRIGLAEGEGKQVDFSIASGVRLFGWVSRGGRPVTEVQLSFSPEHGADVTTTFAKTDAQGNYEVRGVPPGAVMGRVGDHDYRIWVPEGLDELRYDITLAEGIIAGHVYEGRQRAPAKAATVDVYRAGDPKGDLAQHASRWVTSVETGVDGLYEAKGLAGGKYMLHVTHPDFGTRIHGPVELPERGAAEGVDIYLGDPGKIAGFVLNESGLPIAGAAASVRQAETGEPVLRGDVRVLTDEHGLFLVSGIPPGRYLVTVYAVGHAQQSKLVDASGGLERVEFFLGPEANVRVRVRDSSGNPVEHAVLVVWDAFGQPIDPAPGAWEDLSRSQSDAGGFVSRGGLAAGAYRGEVASSRGRATFDFSVVAGKVTEVEVTVQPVREEDR
ncbi:MAG: carboxypeptidase-like regulatory domain-containing protein [Planctomycetota bacterium]